MSHLPLPGTNGQTAPEADLTPTELRLLDALRRQPGRILSRAELIALVMRNSIVLPRTIDVHIRALRKKLGDGCEIRTVRKRGYVWGFPTAQ